VPVDGIAGMWPPVFIQVLGFADRVENKIAAPDIVGQIAEELTAERIIPQILDNASSVGVGVCLLQLFRCGGREPPE
jgi:hypothetical protein